MGTRERLAVLWPLYGLAIATPRLELKLPTDDEIVALAQIAAAGIQAPGEPRFQASWLYEPSPQFERKLFQFVLGRIAAWEPADWELGLAVFCDGAPIGMQSIFAKHFATTGGFGSGSWLGLAHQGRGFGTEMGRAILKLGFDGLGGREAYIGAWADNAASLRVMEKLGYVFNGQYIQPHDGTARLDRRMRLPRDVWESQPRDDIAIAGLAPCLDLFGVTNAALRSDA